MAKSNSLTGIITPVKTPALKRIGQSISVMMHEHCCICVAIQSEQLATELRCSTNVLLFHSGLLVFAQRLDLCLRLPSDPAQRPRRFHAGATANAGVTLWKVMTSLRRKSNVKRCEGQQSKFSSPTKN